MKLLAVLTGWFRNPQLSSRVRRLVALSCLLGGQALADTTPPAVAITFPTSNATYTATLGTGTWTGSGIPLQLGLNVLTVTASDAAGNTGTDTLTVTRQTPSPTTY